MLYLKSDKISDKVGYYYSVLTFEVKEEYNKAMDVINQYYDTLSGKRKEYLPFYRGWANARLGNLKQALSDIDKGLSIHPDSSFGLSTKAWILKEQKKYKKKIIV